MLKIRKVICFFPYLEISYFLKLKKKYLGTLTLDLLLAYLIFGYIHIINNNDVNSADAGYK